MLFTNNEIIFLTSVSRGNAPFGIRYRMPAESERETFFEETIESLVKKGILNDKRKLTEEGAAIIRFFELYRNCRRHVTVNKVKAAVLENRKLITLCKDTDCYEMCCTDSAVMMLSLLKQSEYLCRGEEKAERGKWRGIMPQEWEQTMREMEGCIPVCEYEDAKLLGRKLFYWKGGEGYLLNPERMRVRSLSPSYMRRQLYMILGGKEDE
ncbi:MAG: DUF5081 family protein [Lachnospiraceae bacterium]|nr:DUF5081 family protein [Lachnospiraceae bacterium]